MEHNQTLFLDIQSRVRIGENRVICSHNITDLMVDKVVEGVNVLLDEALHLDSAARYVRILD